MNTNTETHPLEWSPLWAAMKAAPHAWILTTDAMYDEMLNVLPPRAMRRNVFLVGEAERHNEKGQAVYACFKRSAGAVYATYMSHAEFITEQ